MLQFRTPRVIFINNKRFFHSDNLGGPWAVSVYEFVCFLLFFDKFNERWEPPHVPTTPTTYYTIKLIQE